MTRSVRIRVSLHGQELSSRRFEERTLFIGRDAEAHIRLEDVGVSRHHARLDRQGPGYLLRDLESANGTFVENRTVSIWPIKSGDRARIAGFDLDFEVMEEEPKARDVAVPTRGSAAAGAPSCSSIGDVEANSTSEHVTHASDVDQRKSMRRAAWWILFVLALIAAVLCVGANARASRLDALGERPGTDTAACGGQSRNNPGYLQVAFCESRTGPLGSIVAHLHRTSSNRGG